MSLQNKEIIIGLFGFGVVGEGLYKVLQQTPTLNALIKKVCIKHPEKPRNAPYNLFTVEQSDILDDPEINVIIELIDDAEAAYLIAQKALISGKRLISASKKMIAQNLEILLQLQTEYATQFLYEAACCASIPVIRNLEEYYDNDLLKGIQGIVNGSTNYILTKMSDEGLSFEDALLQAQELGFAERNPYLDISGQDALAKLCILLVHSYGIISKPQNIVHLGIQRIKPIDASYAKEKGYKIKLLAQAHKLKDGSIAAFVFPQFVPNNSNLYSVNNEYNGLNVISGLADQQFFSGKGAGSFPTASAVLSDLSALRYDYKYEYKKRKSGKSTLLSNDFYLRVYISFNQGAQVPETIFEHIEEWTKNKHSFSVSGIIHYSKLKEDWWQNEAISIILYPDAIIDDSNSQKQSHLQQNILSQVLN